MHTKNQLKNVWTYIFDRNIGAIRDHTLRLRLYICSSWNSVLNTFVTLTRSKFFAYKRELLFLIFFVRILGFDCRSWLTIIECDWVNLEIEFGSTLEVYTFKSSQLSLTVTQRTLTHWRKNYLKKFTVKFASQGRAIGFSMNALLLFQYHLKSERLPAVESAFPPRNMLFLI